MLRAKNLPKTLWAEAVNAAVYVLNRTTHSSRKRIKIAYEEWTGRKPELSHTRIFGSTAYAHVPKQFRKKLDDKAKKLILVGYQDESSNYRLYDSKKKMIIVSRDIMFDETTTDESTSKGDSEDGALKITRAEQEEDEAVEVSDESDEEEIVSDNVVPRQQEARGAERATRGSSWLTAQRSKSDSAIRQVSI